MVQFPGSTIVLKADGKRSKVDSIKSNYVHLQRKTKTAFPMKRLRKTAATHLETDRNHARYAPMFLGHAPRSVAERHYVTSPLPRGPSTRRYVGSEGSSGSMDRLAHERQSPAPRIPTMRQSSRRDLGRVASAKHRGAGKLRVTRPGVSVALHSSRTRPTSGPPKGRTPSFAPWMRGTSPVWSAASETLGYSQRLPPPPLD